MFNYQHQSTNVIQINPKASTWDSEGTASLVTERVWWVWRQQDCMMSREREGEREYNWWCWLRKRRVAICKSKSERKMYSPSKNAIKWLVIERKGEEKRKGKKKKIHLHFEQGVAILAWKKSMRECGRSIGREVTSDSVAVNYKQWRKKGGGERRKKEREREREREREKANKCG